MSRRYTEAEVAKQCLTAFKLGLRIGERRARTTVEELGNDPRSRDFEPRTRLLADQPIRTLTLLPGGAA
jgi:hypothetical protein